MSGAADDARAVREFAAGSLRATFARADLRYLSIGDVETVRRIYVGVRDATWGTVHPSIGNVDARQEHNGFRIEFDAEHVQGDVNFAWHGLIVAEASGPADVRVRYEMDGVARSRFPTNRTGICVLHPVKECAGAECKVEHPDGSSEASMFPVEVAPHQPFMNVRGLAYRAGGCVEAELRFEGDVFETEDQRNWTDGSYKTYCRPLSLPFPYVLEPGQRVRQVVQVRLNGASASSAVSAPTVTVRSGRAVATVPPIGLAWTRGADAGDRDIDLIRAMRPSHLRLEVRLCDEGWESAASGAAEQVARIGCALEVAAHLSGDVAGELDALAKWARRARPEVGRWVFYDQGKPVTSAETIALARRALRDVAGAARVGGGSVGNFAEVNRARTAVAGMDFVAFPVNPQTHAADDLSLMENLEGQGPTVATAWDFTRAPVAVGPVVLHRRPDPFAAGKSGNGAEVIGDPRQQTLFGAAWTLGSLKALIAAGAASFTYYETVGAFGVLGDGGVFPLYHVLADVLEYAGGKVLAMEQPSLRTCAAMAIRRGGAVRMIVANTRDRSIRIGLSGFDGYRLVGRLELTQATLGDATARPIEFRAGASRGVRGEVPQELELPACAVVRLDLEERR